MAYGNLTDTQKDGLEEVWAELAAMAARAEGFEEACKEAGEDASSTAMRSAMLALSSDMRNGMAPVTRTCTVEEYYEANDDGDEGYAHALARELMRDLVQLQTSLRAARDVLTERADALGRLADMADAALD